eukprot:s1873_g10.t1
MEENGKIEVGKVPLRGQQRLRVRAMFANHHRIDQWDNGREITLSNKRRRDLNCAFEKIQPQIRKHVVSEVFSPPRIVPLSTSGGLAPGTSYDLKTGWNLADAQHRRQMWQRLKQEDPMYLLICPPCKAFSPLQSLNFENMSFPAAFQLVLAGVEHLELGAALFKWQVSRGKYALYEQPDRARSWHEECMTELEQLPGVERFSCDMCMYGLNVTGEGLNQKPTGLLGNSPEVKKRLSRKCDGSHEHVSLMGGIASRAEKYPEEFCRQLILGIKAQVRRDGGWKLFHQERQEIVEVFVEEEDDERVIGEEDAGAEVVGEKAMEGTATEDEKKAVHKLHKGLGHPSLSDLVRFMKAARVKSEVVRWTYKHFRCEACDSRVKPKSVRVGSIPKTYQPNRVVGVDLIYIPEVGGGRLLPALSVVDWGSNYQMVELLQGKEPATVWEAMWRCWMRTFGLPEVIICDAGREFLAEFIKQANGHGVVVYQVGTRAPWQNGKTERHGAYYKELLEKARAELVLSSEEELKLMMQEVEQAKNRYSNRSGFSPVQRQIGQWPRSPAELLSDDAIDPSLVSGALVDDMERLHEMRRIAQKAFVEHNAQKTIDRIERTRSKALQEFGAGDYVYVYRVHRPRKRRGGGQQELDHPRNRPTWVGPGTVVSVDGANIWVTVWGELWKDLIEEYKRGSNKAGFKDLTEELWPAEEEETKEIQDEEDQRQVRFDERMEEMSEPYEPSVAPEDDVQRELERRQSIQTVDEPEMERQNSREESRRQSELDRQDSSGSSAPTLGGPEGVGQQLSEGGGLEDSAAYQDAMRRSQQMSDRLDGVPGQARWRMRPEPDNPMYWEMYLQHEDEDEDMTEEERRERINRLLRSGAKQREDYWEIDPEKQLVIRRHNRKRRALFRPTEECPVDLDMLEEGRRSEMTFFHNAADRVLEDSWRERDSPQSRAWWKGSTVFRLKKPFSREETEAMHVLLAEKKRSDEVDMRKESEKDLREWKEYDAAEWQKIIDSGAVRLLSVEESRKVWMVKWQISSQSLPLERKQGPLYFRQPPEGIEGVDPERIALIIAGCYGLVDAPLHWRKSLTEFLFSIGYKQSKLDPCILKLYHESRLVGMIAIEVDDLLMIGNQVQKETLKKMQEKFRFGKWVNLKDTPEGAMFNGRRIRQKGDGEFQIDMEKFVKERLEEVSLEKGRASKRKDEVTEEERGRLRGLCGSLNWLAKEGRPDLAGPASLLSSRIASAKIEDILAGNEVVRNVKKNAELCIRIQPLRAMKFCVVSDASFGNDGMHSQGGQMIVCHEEGLQNNEKVRANVLCWRSGRIQRVVNSTLAAETQSMSRGLGDLMWVMVLFEELRDESFDIRSWPERLSASRILALASRETSEQLRGSLAVVDAKSLYDQLCKETIGGSDKRTVEIQIIREDLRSLSGSIRWVDHPAMIADGLTKVRGSNASLYRVLRSGMFQLVAEDEHMEARHQAKQDGLGHHAIQLEILLQGMQLLAPQGLLAYSTCALNPVECEAVVCAALFHFPNFETVNIEVPGLELESGLCSWKVPGIGRNGEWLTYDSWKDVPEATGILRRSMFPPSAYATSSVAVGLEKQLRRCGRLLPCNDDGGCFFLALLRHSKEHKETFSKGDRVFVTSVEREGTVRGPGTKQFRGLLRILYADGSQYHVKPEELQKLPADPPEMLSCVGSHGKSSEPLSLLSPLSPLLSDASDHWPNIAAFFGILQEDLPTLAEADGAICLASTSLKGLASIPQSMTGSGKALWTAGRPLFFNAASSRQAPNSSSWPADAFPWQPTAEAASFLATICKHRILKVSHWIFKLLLKEGEAKASVAGAELDWQAGAVLVSPLQEQCPALGRAALVCLLHDGLIRRCARAGAVGHLCALIQQNNPMSGYSNTDAALVPPQGGMDHEAVVNDLFDTCTWLGDYHEDNGKQKYLARERDQCLTALLDLDKMLEEDSPESGYVVRQQLGEWQVLRRRMIPLFVSYQKDSELATNVVKLMVKLTTRVGLYGSDELQHLRHLQDYKEAFSKSDIFTVLLRLVMEALDNEAGPGQQFFKDVLVLIRNLVSVPDPGPGDAGYTPLRRRLQLTYIRHFHDEGVLDFFHFLGEQLVMREENNEDQVWAVAEILYHICTTFDPQEMWQRRKEQKKRDLSELLARDKADSKLMAPQSSRHSRFGTSMQTFSADGSLNVSASVMQKSIIQKSSALLKKEFRNPLGSEKKQNMFHNPFFVDLAEGSVRDHNQLNAHVRGALDDRADHSEKVLVGYRSFLEKCTWMSSLISVLRSSCPGKPTTGSEFKLPYLLNFVSWFLEFHRCQHALQVADAKKKNEPPPDLDIAALQGAIDVDMVQFTTARLRDFGKVAQMHQSQLMVALRVLSQQIQTIKVMTECSGSDTRDCGDILVRHLVKEDIMSNVAWIMKNFKTSVHDPRILSYSVEVWQLMILLMNRLHERYDQSKFQVERARGTHMQRSETTVEQEISSLSDSRVIENLFHLMEKYRRLSTPLQSMLVELIYSIMKAHHTNIVLFFELSFFMRIYRMMTDPLLTNTKNNMKYKDTIGLLEFILESFFQCAQVNSCVFAELLFRKEQHKGEIESTAEFAAILDDYEDENFRRDVLDRYEAGETVNQLREKQKEMLKGQQPWTEEEDKILKENYQLYADHPLCADLLNSQLPETSRRTVAQVRKRLAELGLTSSRGKDKSAEDDRPSKKAKVSELRLEDEGPAPESPGTPKRHADQEAEEMLEEDLERLLDSAYDSCQKNAKAGGEKAAGTAATMLDQSATQEAADDFLQVLEMEMERMLNEEPAGEAENQAQGKAPTQGVATTQEEPDSLEMELERMMDKEVTRSREDEKKDQGKTPTQGVEATEQEPDSLEMELERMMDSEVMATQENDEKPQGQEPSQEAPRSQHVPDSLELDMERLMDGLILRVQLHLA